MSSRLLTTCAVAVSCCFHQHLAAAPPVPTASRPLSPETREPPAAANAPIDGASVGSITRGTVSAEPGLVAGKPLAGTACAAAGASIAGLARSRAGAARESSAPGCLRSASAARAPTAITAATQWLHFPKPASAAAASFGSKSGRSAGSSALICSSSRRASSASGSRRHASSRRSTASSVRSPARDARAAATQVAARRCRIRRSNRSRETSWGVMALS